MRDKKKDKLNKNNKIDAKAPDRNTIMKLLEQRGKPLKRRDIAAALGVFSEGSREILRRRLQAMLRDGQLVRNRKGAYGLSKRMDLISGRVSAHADGFGFVIPDNGSDDLYLSPREMRKVLHGDRILCSLVSVDARGRREGMVVEVLERANERVVGHFVEESGIAMVVADNRRITQDILIPLEDTAGARPGQIVVAEISQQPSQKQLPVGKVIEVLGRSGAPGMATEIAIRSFDLPYEWPDEVVTEAESFSETVDPVLFKGRKDIRDIPVITIDGADSRDFDDGVFAKPTKNGWQLLVAIADVASYVTPGSALDQEAEKRATSVYFPNRVIPMLPEALSNGLCSLKPDIERLCLVCEMAVSREGNVTRSRFYSAVMRSHARLTYNQVWDYLSGEDQRLEQDKPLVIDSLNALYDVYKAFLGARHKRGAIDFDSTEVSFQFDEYGTVDDIVPYARNDAHKLIEECMIAANVEAARYLLKQKIPAPYRVHEPPQETKLESLNLFLSGLGIKITWRDQPSPNDFEQVVEQIQGRPDEALIMAVLLRAQSLAVYQPANVGHFGLALDAYAHFTSPIRRYPDLLVHRAIHYSLQGGSPDQYLYNDSTMEKLSEHCSHLARRADEAEWDVDERLKCSYMEKHVGEEFEGMVSGVTSFGLFVELDGNRVNGLVHVTSLPNDYYHFDPVKHQMTGERRGRVFKLADRLRIKVIGVNMDDRKVDFALADEQGEEED